MFEGLTEKLQSAFKRLRGQGKITPENIADALREVRRALLDADVHYKVAKEFIDEVQKRAVGTDVLTSITPAQQIVRIVYEEMVKLLGDTNAQIIESPSPPTVVLLAGLQGSGKTTLAAKLALYLKSKGRLPLLVAADTFRPAAIDQLQMLGDKIDVPVHSDRSGTPPAAIALAAIDAARKNVRDTVIVDTTGRLHVDEEMMAEIESIKNAIGPQEILFVLDAMTGQDAVKSAAAFHERLDLNGVVLTKLDGDSRGGAALSVRSVVRVPIKFAGVGEKLEALEPFYPDRIASRILGMGDVLTLVEKAREQMDEKKAAKLQESLRKASFTFEDFLDQLQQLRKMGPLNQVMAMIPGMNRMPAQAADEKQLDRAEAIIHSMTTEERTRPSIINGSRRRRIAAGSGTSVQDVNRLLKQFDEMQKLLKRYSKSGSRRALQGFGLPMN
ncbi:MAG TPA: signal recognition particle protein [Bacteroidota bacterium]|nr:signal recognition particle protein [Bacteroidota bacterium]